MEDQTGTSFFGLMVDAVVSLVVNLIFVWYENVIIIPFIKLWCDNTTHRCGRGKVVIALFIK